MLFLLLKKLYLLRDISIFAYFNPKIHELANNKT
jgi:hypothetical protein